MERNREINDQERVFREWVAHYSDMLYRYSLKYFHDEDLAKDLVQETFLAAWRNMAVYKGEVSPKNWLFVILKNKIKDHLKKSSNRMLRGSLNKEQGDSIFFDDQDHWRSGYYPKNWQVDLSNSVETKEFYKVFTSCTGKLKEIQNSVFVMKYVEGMKSEEICKILDITSSNYWVLIHRAKLLLRACLEKNWMQ